jgi:hypothetical protein
MHDDKIMGVFSKDFVSLFFRGLSAAILLLLCYEVWVLVKVFYQAAGGVDVSFNAATLVSLVTPLLIMTYATFQGFLTVRSVGLRVELRELAKSETGAAKLLQLQAQTNLLEIRLYASLLMTFFWGAGERLAERNLNGFAFDVLLISIGAFILSALLRQREKFRLQLGVVSEV